MKKASSTELKPGENSIDRAKPSVRRGRLMLDWRICLPNGEVVRKRTEAPARTRHADLRARAHATAAKILEEASPQALQSSWSLSDGFATYMDQVSRERLAEARLAPRTVVEYSRALELLINASGKATIEQMCTPRALKGLLSTIEKSNGAGTAHQARTVLSKYVLRPLAGLDQLIPSRHLLDDVDHGRSERRSELPATLTKDEWSRVLEHLLERSPELGIEVADAWNRKRAIMKSAQTIKLTLLQMVTGMRLSEALALTWDDVSVRNGQTHVSIRDSKTGRPRTIPMLDERVAMLLTRDESPFVIHSPTTPTKWDSANAGAAVRAFYPVLAEELGIPVLAEKRTHLWRATLNTILAESVPSSTRAAFLGHSESVNERAYTANVDLSKLRAQLS
ncbi:tyrosine-type recombinase/integrase [Dermabacter hominis]|uniref:tyrosine-type recombinase/integrase n=1 Tax=Dermabacter hominis TaxID=36740 RepID=UPI0021A8F17A|nr:tyrosine-type recombinase/integrase [Dermabacter hominis]MCT1716400.1 tyrosine-type recombinase/integrase [Dermabacter hominis]